MSSSSLSRIAFGPFDVSTQVFYETPLSFALVNLKPLLPGHVLVCPKKPHRRLTDLDAAELVDLFAAVQVVERMLAAVYFGEQDGKDSKDGKDKEQLQKGSFNLAVQDGPEAGQTVPHVHVHVIPRIRGTTAKDLSTEGDALYEQMSDEPGNVGGAQWDAAPDSERRDSSRPRPGGRFPRIEDASREARTMEAMEAEAADFRQALANLGVARHK